MGGNGAARVVEVVPSQTGTDFCMIALFNPNQLAYPDVINDFCIALLARADLATGTGYAVHFQCGWSGIGIIKFDPALPGGYANIGTGVAVPDLPAYNIDVRVAGSTIAYNLYDSARTFIGGHSRGRYRHHRRRRTSAHSHFSIRTRTRLFQAPLYPTRTIPIRPR